MEPRIIEKEARAIAGVSGSGDETGKAWQTFMKLNKLNPLNNKLGEEGYEIRIHSGEGPGDIHIGLSVKDADIPAEYKLFFLPASMYAVFEIYPSRGYESSNEKINNWLSDNAETYKQKRMGDRYYTLEVYDDRYKNDKDPESVVDILIPVVKKESVTLTTIGNNMPKIIAEQTEEMGRRIEEFASVEIRKKVMEGIGEITTFEPVKNSVWYKEAIDRLDALTEKTIREQIMNGCGYHCQAVFSELMEDARDRRRFFKTEEEFLKYELNPPPGTGVRYEIEGDIIYNYYTPRAYGRGMRCYCYLIGTLPEGINASPTYCQCSRAFVQAYWEGALGRPVQVELGETAISSGTEECKFIIHL